MKTLTLGLILIFGQSFLLAASPPQGVDPKATYYEKTQVWVLETSSKQTVWYNTGIKKGEGELSDKKRQGSWVFYYENGKKKGEGKYDKGMMVGVWKTYHPNGNIQSEGSYAKNLREGPWVFHTQNGTKDKEGPYKSGRKSGEWISYYPSGQVFFKGVYANNQANGAWTYYFASGILHQQGTYENDKRVGVWKICIFEKDACQLEDLTVRNIPRFSGLSNEPVQFDSKNTKDPGSVLDSLDSGPVPDDVPPSVRGNWDD